MARKKSARRRRFSSRRVFRRYSRPKMTLPIGILAGFAPGLIYGVNGFTSTSGALDYRIGSGMRNLLVGYTGWDSATRSWNLANMRIGAAPLAIGVIAHKVAGALGVNRAIARLGIPLIRI